MNGCTIVKQKNAILQEAIGASMLAFVASFTASQEAFGTYTQTPVAYTRVNKRGTLLVQRSSTLEGLKRIRFSEIIKTVKKIFEQGREGHKQVRINIRKTPDYLEGGNQVSPKSAPL